LVSQEYSIDENAYFNNLKSIFFEKNTYRTFDKAFLRLNLSLPDNWEEFVINKVLTLYRNFIPDPEELEIIEENFAILNSYRKKNVPIFLLTNGNYMVQKNKIKALRIENYFEDILISDFFGKQYRKPSLYMFHLILKKYNIDPKDIIYFGDNDEIDGCCESLNIRFVNLGINNIKKENYNDLK